MRFKYIYFRVRTGVLGLCWASALAFEVVYTFVDPGRVRLDLAWLGAGIHRISPILYTEY